MSHDSDRKMTITRGCRDDDLSVNGNEHPDPTLPSLPKELKDKAFLGRLVVRLLGLALLLTILALAIMGAGF